MRADKRPLSVRTSRRTVAVALDKAAEYAAESEFSYGFDRSEGTLARGAGAEEFSPGAALPSGEAPAALFRVRAAAGDAFALVCRSGKLYGCAPGGAFADAGVTFAGVPAAAPFFDADGKECLALSDGAAVAVLSENGAEKSETIPAFACAAFHFERLWSLNGAKARFSSPADACDFTAGRGGGGAIDFPDGAGAIAAALPFRGGLYLLRERGVQELAAEGDERAFRLRDVCACTRICGATAAAAPEGIFWLAEDGLYRFDGARAEPFAEEFAPVVAGADLAAARAAVWGNRYVLQARARLGGREEDVLAVLRTDGAGGYVLRRAVSGLTACGGEVFFVCGGKVCRLRGDGPFLDSYGRAAWAGTVRAPWPDGTLRALRVRLRGQFTLTVMGGRGLRRAEIAGDGETKVCPVRLAGDSFVVRLETDGPGCVYALSAQFTRSEAQI